jgi:MYXO-CTERM domain-containing protein
MVALGDLPGGEFWSYANAVSADGSVVVGSGRVGTGVAGDRAFRWTQATGMVQLDVMPGAQRTVALDASGDGTIVVGFYTHPARNNSRPAIWTSDGKMRDLQDMLVNDLKYDLTGLELGDANISADGRWVTGGGINPSGQYEAWVANIAPIPEPSSVALAGLGLAGLAGYGWRRRRWKGAGNRREQPTAAQGPP